MDSRHALMRCRLTYIPCCQHTYTYVMWVSVFLRRENRSGQMAKCVTVELCAYVSEY